MTEKSKTKSSKSSSSSSSESKPKKAPGTDSQGRPETHDNYGEEHNDKGENG